MKFTTLGAVWSWLVECWLMQSRMKIRFPFLVAQTAMGIALLAGAVVADAQAPARFVGTITAISGNTLTVKTDVDGVHQVNVPAGAPIKRIAPGQKDLSTAETISFSDLAIGDRALVKLDPGAPAGTEEALQIVAVKQADLALKQQKDREDWQRRGVGGLVKSVDAATGDIVLFRGSGVTAKTITVHTTKATTLKRYAPASVRFDEAQPAPIDAIHAGDQLRARGTKNADGTEIAAEDVVSGTFRNIAGTISSLDAARLDTGGQGSGHQEAGHDSHYSGCADAALAGDDGADAGGAAERKHERRRGHQRRTAARGMGTVTAAAIRSRC